MVFFMAFSCISMADSEPNDTIQEAEILTLGQEVSGTLDSNTDDLDYYNISFTTGSDIIAKLNGPDLADYDLSIYDHNGTKIAGSSTDWDAHETLIFHPTETGFYYIGIWAYDGNGSYTLLVENPKTTSNDTYDIQDAVNKGYIEAEITGVYEGNEDVFDLKNGKEVFYGLCVKVSLTSLVANDLDIMVPCGLTLIPWDEEVEDKVITKTSTIHLESLSSNETEIFAMSTDMYKNIPVLHSTFKIGDMASGDILKIAKHIGEHDHQSSAGQAAIWIITDDATDNDLENIGATSSTVKAAKEILVDSGVTPADNGDGAPQEDGSAISEWIVPLIVVVFIAFLLIIILSRRSPRKPAGDKGSSFGDMEPVKPAEPSKTPKSDIPPPRRQPPTPPPPPPL
jgi:hypothetical protein